QASPRHVPDEIIAVPGVPHTRTGKRLEVPLKRLFQGVDPAKAVNTGTVDDASLVEHYISLARSRAASPAWPAALFPEDPPCFIGKSPGG
ncbi:MAG: hypothetical protein ACXVF0_18840, partial [Blastococcus sp.]